MSTLTRSQNTKLMVCSNPGCIDPRPERVAHDTIRYTCGICMQTGYKRPHMEQLSLTDMLTHTPEEAAA